MSLIKTRIWLLSIVISKMIIPKRVGSCFNSANNHNHDYFIQIRS